ncbi:amidohydrolase family protein [Lysobacter sp. A3-1-A15]|uniref:amidohydrolase family protein n=1 Tax=Novilysobacter viscosus TaxID=3098602 RepID=UPI002ED9CBD9
MLRKLLLASAAGMGLLLLVTAALLMAPLPMTPGVGVSGDFLVRNVAVVDVGRGAVRHGQDVVLRDGRIEAVRPTGTAQPDGSLTTIDGSGKYLMPGLWDMHTHALKISPQYTHPLFIANGVTGVRDMSGCMSEPDSFLACIEDRQAWNRALERGESLAPRYVLQTGFKINGGAEVPEGYPAFFKARNAAEVRQLVTFYRHAGADFLKTYSELTPANYQALAVEARRQGLGLAGHRPLRVPLQDMLAAGHRSVEHPRMFYEECFPGAAAFRALPDPAAAYDTALRWRMVNEHDSRQCADLMAVMARSQTWWTPTLQVLGMGARAGDEAFRTDPRLKYVPVLFTRLLWTPDADRMAVQPMDADGREQYTTLYRMAVGHVGQAHAAGVKILAGTDAGDTYVFPGFGIHDELVEFVRAGLTPADAIRSATLDAAVFARLDDDFGSIETGKAADLLLLDANPLDDVRHTRRIAGLFFSGKYLDRAALDELLAFAEQQAGSVRTNLHLLWGGLSSPLLRVQAAD